VALRLDGSGPPKQLWKVKSGAAYVVSPVAVGGRYYYVEGNGLANCLDGRTGKRLWRERLNGSFHASPVPATARFTSPARRV